MKKKIVEQCPYIVPQEAEAKYTYTAVARLLDEIGTLIVEVYDNVAKAFDVPIVRMCYTKKDWCMYYPHEGKWKKHSIEYSWKGYCWADPDKAKGVEHYQEQKTWISDEGKALIENFTNYKRWGVWDSLKGLETAQGYDAQARKREKEEEKLKKRCEDLPELPAEVYPWVEDHFFHDSDFLYYKNKGRYSDIFCSACGNSYKAIFETRNDIEELTGIAIPKPIDGNRGICKKCKVQGTYKPIGRARAVYGETKRFYVGQRFRDEAAVIRYIEVDKIYSLERPAEIGYTEIARVYFEGNKVQKDYHLRDHWTEREYWADYNIGGMKNIQLKEGEVFPGTWEALKETILKYSGAEEFCRLTGSVKLVQYMEAYKTFPQTEILAKMGCHLLINRIMEGWGVRGLRTWAKNPQDFLGIHKERVKQLRRAAGDPDLLRLFQMERSLDQRWTDKQLEAVLIMKTDVRRLSDLLDTMSMTQLCGRIEKYAGCSFDSDRSADRHKLHDTAVMYMDYLDMRKRNGYDLQNMIIQHPRDLEAAHHKMVEEESKKALDARLKEVREKYPNVAKNYKKLKRTYGRKDAQYIIRPARNAEEIVMEGRELHHCVGGDLYLEKHSTGRSAILFLRKADKPDIPYITIEIKDAEIQQWFGAYDKKPDKENVQKYLNAYITELKCSGKLKNDQKERKMA